MRRFQCGLLSRQRCVPAADPVIDRLGLGCQIGAALLLGCLVFQSGYRAEGQLIDEINGHPRNLIERTDKIVDDTDTAVGELLKLSKRPGPHISHEVLEVGGQGRRSQLHTVQGVQHPGDTIGDPVGGQIGAILDIIHRNSPGILKAAHCLHPLIDRRYYYADYKGDPEQRIGQKGGKECPGSSGGDPGRCGLDSQCHSVGKTGCRKSPENRFNGSPVVHNQLGSGADHLQHRLEGIHQDILCHCPYLRIGIGHGFKIPVDLVRRGQHGIFDDLRRDLSVGSHVTDSANRYIEIVRYGLDNGGSLLKDRVQFLTTENTRGHGLGELQHGGALAFGRRSGNGKLLVDQLSELHQFIGTSEGISCHNAHLGNGVRCVQIGGTGAVCRLHDSLLQLIRRGPGLVHALDHQIQPGPGGGHTVRQLKHPLGTVYCPGAEQGTLDPGHGVRQRVCRISGVVQVLHHLFQLGIVGFFRLQSSTELPMQIHIQILLVDLFHHLEQPVAALDGLIDGGCKPVLQCEA